MSKYSSNVVRIQLSQNGKYGGKYEAFADEIDRDLAELNWFIRPGIRSKAIYAIANIVVDGKKTTVRLHRIIMKRMLGRPLTSIELIDHINGNGLDNRRENLRLATPNENSRDRAASVTNKTGYKGVDLHKASGKYRAQIKTDYQSIHLGLFDTPELAHAAYCVAAKKYHMEFANFENLNAATGSTAAANPVADSGETG